MDEPSHSARLSRVNLIVVMVMNFHALIQTHHITSRKKVAALRKAADKFSCFVLLRSGGCPGIMYCKGDEDGVREWVGTVQVSINQFEGCLKNIMLMCCS